MNVYVAEFLGTAILILLGNGIVANTLLKGTKGHDSNWLTGAVAWGFAVAFAVVTVGRISGAHLNPAVTFGLAAIGEFEWQQIPGYVIAQMLGAFVGSILVFLVYYPHWSITEEAGNKLACFATGPAIRSPISNIMTEAIATSLLVFGVLSIGAIAKGTEGAADGVTVQEGLKLCFQTWFGPILVGALVCSIGLSLGGPTGYAINPARDLAPRIAHAILPIAGKGDSDWSYAFVPVLGPIIGGVLGAVLFKALGL